MKVFPELSKNAWIILLTLAEAPCQASEISKKTSLGLNRISEALKALEQCNILPTRKRRAVIILDSQLKNILKQFLAQYSKEQLVGCFEGKKLNTLFQILEDYDTVSKLKLVTGYSTPTLKRITTSLQKDLLIFQKRKGVYLPRDEFKPRIRLLYSAFFGYFADSLERQGIKWKKLIPFGNTVLLESDQEEIPGFVRTSLSRFHEYQVELIMTSYNFFVNSNRVQAMEEVFIHALAVSKKDFRYIMYCTLFADLNKMNVKQLKELPIIFKVETEAKQIFDYIDSNGKTKTVDDYLTPYQEYLQVRRDYART